MRYPASLRKLIEQLKRLPGVGQKSAERFAFQLLAWPQSHLEELGSMLASISSQLKPCSECGCLTEVQCDFCIPRRKESQSLCVLAHPRDVYALEGTSEYQGLYHVLGGVLSPMEGFSAEHLSIAMLKQRVQQYQIKEVILALDSTLEGDATSLYLKQELEQLGPKMTRLAFGLPMGSSLDYIDGGTLARALQGRNYF